jgi:hypothetical protein
MYESVYYFLTFDQKCERLLELRIEQIVHGHIGAKRENIGKIVQIRPDRFQAISNKRNRDALGQSQENHNLG